MFSVCFHWQTKSTHCEGQKPLYTIWTSANLDIIDWYPLWEVQRNGGDILRRGTRDIANLRRAKEILVHHIFKDILAAEILVCLYETIIYSKKLKYYSC